MGSGREAGWWVAEGTLEGPALGLTQLPEWLWMGRCTSLGSLPSPKCKESEWVFKEWAGGSWHPRIPGIRRASGCAQDLNARCRRLCCALHCMWPLQRSSPCVLVTEKLVHHSLLHAPIQQILAGRHDAPGSAVGSDQAAVSKTDSTPHLCSWHVWSP